MRIRILESAVADLAAGKDFYDRQEIGVGEYFQDCLFSDIDSLGRVDLFYYVDRQQTRDIVGLQ